MRREDGHAPKGFERGSLVEQRGSLAPLDQCRREERYLRSCLRFEEKTPPHIQAEWLSLLTLPSSSAAAPEALGTYLSQPASCRDSCQAAEPCCSASTHAATAAHLP